ncbi:MAG: hypothetical protein M3Q03_12615 [Chloroflexota bacterium]|nr:hypothetical protein [Chloroflexota bacterium]
MHLAYHHSRSLPCSPAARVAVLVALVVLAAAQAPTGGLAAPGRPPGWTEIRVLHDDTGSPEAAPAGTVSFAAAASPLAPRAWLPNRIALTQSWEAAWRWVVGRVVRILVAQGDLLHYNGRPPRP